MTRKQHILGLVFIVFISLFTFFFLPYLSKTLRLATGYAAKYVCSQMHVAQLDLSQAREGLSFFPVSKVKVVPNEDHSMFTATLWGMGRRRAYTYRKGRLCGCTLTEPLNMDSIPNIPEASTGRDTVWPFGDRLNDRLQRAFPSVQKIQVLLDKYISQNDEVRAVVVANKAGGLLESYGPGIGRDTRLLGWSMTKTFNTLFYGHLEQRQMFDHRQRPSVDPWMADERKEITFQMLLQMNSGLSWEEEYSSLSPATDMLFFQKNMGQFAQTRTLEARPGTHWEYSSGTSNILSYQLHKRLETAYFSYPFSNIFDRIGMHSAVVEMDLSGHYVMSSYGWATARDWTRMGLLFLNEGQWGEDRVFPGEWQGFMTTQAGDSHGQYGAQLWLNHSREYPDLPENTYFADGFGNQRVFVFPDQDLVVTVLTSHGPDLDLNTFVREILDHTSFNHGFSE